MAIRKIKLPLLKNTHTHIFQLPNKLCICFYMKYKFHKIIYFYP